jgi:RimJ/RimL family protein N-acetyltransferase
MRILRIAAEAEATPYLDGMAQLLSAYRQVLADDFTLLDSLLGNTLACAPYLWLLVDDATAVLSIAGLTDVLPGHTACLHGVSAASMRRHAAVNEMAAVVFRAAFDELGLYKLKAVFDADNPGALGFCRKWRFRREARLCGETSRAGRKVDALVYALFRSELLPCHFNPNIKGGFHVTRS